MVPRKVVEVCVEVLLEVGAAELVPRVRCGVVERAVGGADAVVEGPKPSSHSQRQVGHPNSSEIQTSFALTLQRQM